MWVKKPRLISLLRPRAKNMICYYGQEYLGILTGILIGILFKASILPLAYIHIYSYYINDRIQYNLGDFPMARANSVAR